MFKNLNPQLKMGLMLAACALPMLGIVAVRALELSVSNVVLFALAVACPVSHLLMMRMGMHNHGATDSSHVHSTNVHSTNVHDTESVAIPPTSTVQTERI